MPVCSTLFLPILHRVGPCDEKRVQVALRSLQTKQVASKLFFTTDRAPILNVTGVSIIFDEMRDPSRDTTIPVLGEIL